MFPCDDELYVSSVGETTVTNHDHDGHNHEDGEDFCSPFCVCAITNLVEVESICSDEIENTIFNDPNFIYLALNSKQITSKVFQPPKG